MKATFDSHAPRGPISAPPAGPQTPLREEAGNINIRTPIRVMVADPHPIFRHGVKAALQNAGELSLCGEAETATDAVRRAEETRPDVVLLELRFPEGDGIQACRELLNRDASIKVLILTAFQDDQALHAAILAGASGYLIKDSVAEHDLPRMISLVARGKCLLDPEVTGPLLGRLRRDPRLLEDEKLARLSPQEERILSLIAGGKTNGEIGEKLGIVEKTVKNYVSSILSKLQVARRAEAAAYVARLKALRS